MMSCYYNENAEKFLNSTKDVDMSKQYEAFLKKIPMYGLILDAGCGSGRDSLAFKEKGYGVVAMDSSEKMCQFAGEYIGQSVLFCRFQDMHFTVRFDGIWASASLVHTPSNELVNVLRRMAWHLKETGYIYTSFKYGDFEGERDGRYFLDLNEQKARRFFTEAGICIDKMWITNDVRPEHGDEKWLNILGHL